MRGLGLVSLALVSWFVGLYLESAPMINLPPLKHLDMSMYEPRLNYGALLKRRGQLDNSIDEWLYSFVIPKFTLEENITESLHFPTICISSWF